MRRTSGIIFLIIWWSLSFLEASPLEEAHRKLRDREYQQAAQLLEKILLEKETEELLYLLGNTYYLAGDYGKSREYLERLLKTYPKGKLKFRAQYKIADTFIKEKKFQNSYQIYLEQVKRLTSSERKASLAQIYLKYAEKFYKPEDPDTKPNFGKALRLYQEAVELSLHKKLANEVLLKQALCNFNLNQFHNAIQILEKLKKTLNEKEQPKLLEQTLFYLGENYFKLNQRGKARLLYKDFLSSYPKSELSPKALFMIIKTYKFPSPYNIDDLESGIQISKEFLEKYPTHESAPEVSFNIGLARFNKGQYDNAIKDFKEVSPLFRNNEKAKEFVASAERMIGYAFYYQKKYQEATQAWSQYLSNHPTDKNWNRVQKELINLDYNQAYEFYKKEKWNEGRAFFAEFLNKHPLDSRAPSVMSYIGQTHLNEKNYPQAIVEWSKLVSKFPSTNPSSYAQFAIGEIYEQKLFDFEKALEAYRKLTWGNYYSKAQQRIREMKEKSLSVVTERIFYPGEKTALKVTTRNLESLKVKIYKINLFSFFKKMNSSKGLEKLDLALIEPNHTYEHKFDKFEKYRLTETQLELPASFHKDPGVYAVNLSTDKLEAITFVVISNLSLILKSTRQDLLVFAEDMNAKKAAANVDIYVSDGQKIVFTGKTNSEGVFKLQDKKLKEINNLRVFGVSNGNVASNDLRISNLAFGQGLSPRGYIYCDRPAYKPGEEVNIRGIIREVVDSRYHFKEKEKYQVEVSSAAGKQLLDTEVELSAFGSFHAKLKIPSGSSLGTYQIRCFQKGKSNFTGNFIVQEYELERFKLVVEPEKPYYFRGETIKGVIKASYYYGEPVVNKPITFSLTGQASATIQSDAKGEVQFSFPTTDYNEKQLLSLSARIDGENVSTVQQIWLATRGFELKLSSLRNVFLTKEAFDVNIKATEISGKGIETELSYEVFHLVSSQGTVAENKIKEGKVKTDAQGNGKVRLTLTEGGNHRIRIQGEDRFKNTITQQHEVFISGEEDKDKLRILSDSDQFKVGDEEEVNLVWRGEESLALITYEGERIYKHSLFVLKKGSNSFKINFDSLLSPNFSLGVAVMDGNKFSSISKEFKVVRELVVKVKTNQNVYAPGDDIEVTLETTDTQGNGLSAQLSLALIDEALLNQFPGNLPPITEFFYGQKRQIRVATTATNTFAYQGITSKISAAILRDQQERVLLGLRATKPNSAPRAPAAKNSSRAEAGFLNNEIATLEDSSEAKSEMPFDSNTTAGQKLSRKQKRLKNKGSKDPKKFAPNEDQGKWGNKDLKFGGDDSAEEEKTERSKFLTTGYWNPSIVTSEKGVKTIKFKLPANTTSWRLVLYGVDQDVLVGKASQSIQVKKDFFIELKTPKSLVEKDSPKPLVIIHNYTQKELLVDVGLEATNPDGSSSNQQKQIKVKHGVLEEVSFPLVTNQKGKLKLRAWATAEGHKDAVHQSLQVFPLATKFSRGTGGLASQTIKKSVVLPADKNYFQREFYLQFGPQLSSLLFSNRAPEHCGGTIASSNGTIALTLLKYLEAIGTSSGAKYSKYKGLLNAALAQIKVTQNNDGGWGFSGVNENNARHFLYSKRGSRYSDPQISAFTLKLLISARQKGFSGLDSSISTGTTYLKNAFSRAQSNSEKVVLLYTLSSNNAADYAYVNRLYRIRHSLDTYSLAHLSLVFTQINRPEKAAEIAQILAKKDIYNGNQNDEELKNPWVRDSIELVARAAQAFIQTKMPKETVERAINHLIAHRSLYYWPSPKGNAAAVEAIASYLGQYQHSEDRYEVRITLNGKTILTERIEGAVPLKEIKVPLTVNHADLEIELKGKGQFTYQAMIHGWVEGIDETDKHKYIQLEQHYTPAPLTFEGKEIPRGFSILTGKYEPWINEVRHLGEGYFTRMVLTPKLNDADKPEGFLVLEQPIPGGATILEPTIKGDFENYEKRNGKIIFYLGNKTKYGSIQFDLFGFLQGEYQILPPVIRSLFEPYRESKGKAIRLKVIARSEKSPDAFKMTPEELYYLGKAHFDANDHQKASPLLKELFENYEISDHYYKETVRMLLYISIEKDQSKDIVKYFEILKERYPKLIINFERIIKIGLAYGAIKEFERGLQVFKATVQANFIREGNISGTLEAQGEFMSSLEFMKDLLKNYPDFPISEIASYSLSQLVYEKADEAARTEEMTKKKITRENLIEISIELLNHFLNLHPDNPIADEASFSLANTFLDLDQYQNVVDMCNHFANRFSKSTYLDDFLYIQGYSYFYLRNYKDSIELLNKLITERFVLSSNEVGLSENRYLARYIIGQIYHARGDAKKAIENYQEIQKRFSDAKEAIDFFERKELKLKEISTFQIGEPVVISLKHRNIKEVDLKAYKVDLMKLYLLKKNLNQITNIHLAGIEPFLSKTIPFSDEFQDVTSKISLEIKDPGAYLLMLKGDALDTSAMVLISDLKVDVQEDPQSGLVRVNVLNRKSHACADQVHVKVIGSRNSSFISGETDLRGLFLANNIRGAATVITKKDNQYGFYRGEKQLQQRRQRYRGLQQDSLKDLDKLIQEQNKSNRMRNSDSIRRLFKSKQKGVQIEKAY